MSAAANIVGGNPAPTGSPTMLKVDGLSKAFGGLQVVTDVSFDVPTGGRSALIGPNGAGKTTLFNLISGVYSLDAGRVLLGSDDISSLPSRVRVGRGLARSFQNIRLMPHLSVVENVMVGQHARASGIGAMLSPLGLFGNRRWRAEAEAQLAALGLDGYVRETVSNLPYGVRKKIEVVRALMAKPRMLLLDEPAAGLNPKETGELKDFLRRISDSGITMLVVEHDMSLVRSLCDHAVVLNFGRKIYDGPTRRVQEDPVVLEAYLGRRHAKDVAAPAEVAHAS